MNTIAKLIKMCNKSFKRAQNINSINTQNCENKYCYDSCFWYGEIKICKNCKSIICPLCTSENNYICVLCKLSNNFSLYHEGCTLQYDVSMCNICKKIILFCGCDMSENCATNNTYMYCEQCCYKIFTKK